MASKTFWGGLVDQLTGHMHEQKPVNYKFDKTIDSGPLDPNLDTATQQTVQDERIRRQEQNAVLKTAAKPFTGGDNG